MALPHIALTDSQHRLLTELMLSDLPVSGQTEVAVARGLDPNQLLADVPGLLWMGLIEEAHGSWSVTAVGAAIFHRTEQENAESRLADVAAFADAIEATSGCEIDQRRISNALRHLAQGIYSLDEAISYLHAGD